jgi:hypothetical protein
MRCQQGLKAVLCREVGGTELSSQKRLAAVEEKPRAKKTKDIYVCLYIPTMEDEEIRVFLYLPTLQTQITI